MPTLIELWGINDLAIITILDSSLSLILSSSPVFCTPKIYLLLSIFTTTTTFMSPFLIWTKGLSPNFPSWFCPDPVFLPETKVSFLKRINQIMSLSCFQKLPSNSFPITLNENRNSSLWPLGPKWSGFCQPFQPLAPLPHLGFSHTGPCYSLNTSQGFCTCWPLCLKCYSPDRHKVGFLSSIRSGLTCAPFCLISPVGTSLWYHH